MKMYLIQREIDGRWYCGRIPAHNWADADWKCRQAGLTLDGEFVPGRGGIDVRCPVNRAGGDLG
jgi:hypothetical protein